MAGRLRHGLLLLPLLLLLPGPAVNAEEPVYYFAYGSNLDPLQMEQRGVAFRGREPARLDGYALAFNKRSSRRPGEGFANIVPAAGAVVEGALYALTGEDLALLDAHEGVPAHYRRRQVQVRTADGRRLAATAYVACPAQVSAGLKPSREYLERLLAGADLLSDGYLARLRAVETAEARQ